VNDSSADAFEKRIDRMMATQQYGERWGRHWLDLVRYPTLRRRRRFSGAGDVRVPELRDSVVHEGQAYDQFLRNSRQAICALRR